MKKVFEFAGTLRADTLEKIDKMGKHPQIGATVRQAVSDAGFDPNRLEFCWELSRVINVCDDDGYERALHISVKKA